MHGDQDGFTMRTFEAAGVGGVQLVDRTDTAGLYATGSSWWASPHSRSSSTSADVPRSTLAWAESIRAAARERTLAEHTFDHRVEVLEASWDTV